MRSFGWTGRGRRWRASPTLTAGGRSASFITAITKGEVVTHLRQAVGEASKAVQRFSATITHAGCGDLVETMRDQSAALSKVEAAFGDYLRTNGAVTVPLVADLDCLVRRLLQSEAAVQREEKG
jgi:hypothetical protein